MGEWIDRIMPIDWALILAVVASALLALPVARRGGRYRALPGWVGFWVGFAGLLLALDNAPRWFSYPLLGVLMYAVLRNYFFLAPVRPRDRYAVLVTYLVIPFVLYPAYIGSAETFLATVPVALFLFIPFFLALGPAEKGMLDSTGRTLLGVVFFVFCAGHLALLPDLQPQEFPGRATTGLPQLFGVLVLASELPRRLMGDFVCGERWTRPAIGVLFSLFLVLALGFYLAPWCNMEQEDGARAGAFVLLAVTLGAVVSTAVAADLSLSNSAARVGRSALLGRMVPAVYAAPVYFHYLNHFA